MFRKVEELNSTCNEEYVVRNNPCLLDLLQARF